MRETKDIRVGMEEYSNDENEQLEQVVELYNVYMI